MNLGNISNQVQESSDHPSYNLEKAPNEESKKENTGSLNKEAKGEKLSD